MKTTIYYFSATGNSLYAARFLRDTLPEAEILSVPAMLRQKKFISDSERVGFIFPQHYYGLPMLIEEFVENLSLPKAKYIFAVVTCGLPYIGRPFSDLNEILAKKNLHTNADWYLRLVSNYLLYRDTAADWRIKLRYVFAEKKLQKISGQIAREQPHTTWQLRKKWSHAMHDAWEERRSELDERFLCDTEKCVHCGLCERVCPVGNIKRPNGFPEWQHNCVECLGCLHICPKQAIDCTEVTKGRKRYIHWQVKPQELFER